MPFILYLHLSSFIFHLSWVNTQTLLLTKKHFQISQPSNNPNHIHSYYYHSLIFHSIKSLKFAHKTGRKPESRCFSGSKNQHICIFATSRKHMLYTFWWLEVAKTISYVKGMFYYRQRKFREKEIFVDLNYLSTNVKNSHWICDLKEQYLIYNLVS